MSLRKLLNRTTPADKLLLSALLLLSFAGIIFIRGVLPRESTVRIEVDGKPVYLLPLDEDRNVTVEGPRGKTFIEIKNHRVRVADSPCPEKLCVGQGWAASGALICIPNKVVITIGGREGKRSVIDAITG